MRWLLLVLCTLALGAADAPWERLAAATATAEHDPAAAGTALRELLQDEPELHAAHYNLGCLLLADDAATAARHLQLATAAPQTRLQIRAWHNLAHARYRLGQLEAALAAAEQALARDDSDPDLQRTRDELRRVLLERRDAARRAALQPRLVERELPLAWVGEAYATRLEASGGGGEPYRFALGEGQALPAGLELEADGRLAGTPVLEAIGDHQLKLTISDHSDRAGPDRAHLVVLPTPAILTDRLPEAILDQAYAAPLRSQGMVAPSWSAEGLPPGLRIEGSGDAARIAGRPSAAGSHRLRLRVSDPYHQLEAELELMVGADRFVPAQTRLPPATAWRPYQFRCSVRGPEDSYTWSGPPTGGLRIARDGRLSGSPDAAGELMLPVTITNAAGEQVTAELQLSVNPPPVIETGQTLDLVRGRPAAARIAASGGTPPLRWRTIDPLPPGLSLEEDGRLSGMPTEEGESNPSVRVEDRWGAHAQAPITIRIQDPPQDQQQDQPGEGEQQPGEGEQQPDEGEQQDGDGEQQPGEGEQPGAGEQQDGEGEQQPGEGDQQQPGQDPALDPGQDGGDGAGEAHAEAEAARRAAEDAARQAQRLDEAAAQRWLEQLPEEESAIEMFLLPENTHGRIRQGDQPW